MRVKWFLSAITYFAVTSVLPTAKPFELKKSCVDACLGLVTPSVKPVQDNLCGAPSGDAYSNDDKEECDRHCGDIVGSVCVETGRCRFQTSLEVPSSPLFEYSEFTAISLQWNNSKEARSKISVYVLEVESNQTATGPLEILPYIPRYHFVNVSNNEINPTKFIVKNLPAETKYKFRVSALGPGGTSAYSAWSTWYPTNSTCKKTTFNYTQFGSIKTIQLPCPTTQLKMNVSLKIVPKKAVVLDATLSWKPPSDLHRLNGIHVKVTVELLSHANDLCMEYHNENFEKLFRHTEKRNYVDLLSDRKVGRHEKSSIHFGCSYSVKIDLQKPLFTQKVPKSFATIAKFHIPECLQGVRSCPVSNKNDPKAAQDNVESKHIDIKISQDSNGTYTASYTWKLEAWKSFTEVEFFHVTVERWNPSGGNYLYNNDIPANSNKPVYHIASHNMSEENYRIVVRAYHGKNCLHDLIERETFKIVNPCNGYCPPNSTCFPKNAFNGSASCRCNKGYTANGTFCEVIRPCDGGCHSNATCSQKNAFDEGASCVCNNGFTGDGTFCAELPVETRFHKQEKDHVNMTAIMIPIGLLVALVLLIGISLWWRRQKRKRITNELFIGLQVASPVSSSNSNLYQHFPSTRRRSDGDSPVKRVDSIGDREVNVIYVPQEIQDAIALGLTDGYEFNAEQLKLGICLGKGAFGNVYCAEAQGIGTDPGWTSVAVKTLSDTESEKGVDDFIEEIQLMKKLGDHENVIKMLGCCTLSLPICLILEYAPYGNLLTYLRTLRNKLEGNILVKDMSLEKELPKKFNSEKQMDGKGNDAKILRKSSSEMKDYPGTEPISDFHDIDNIIESSELESFALQIAKGMAYVAGRGIVHRDLAARNILIGNDRTLKISDFGLSKEGIYVKTTSGKIPLRWLSVEAIRERRYSVASDVWAFGIVLWEICTLGGFPYPTISDRDLLRYLENGKRMDKPTNCTNEIYTIMLDCWSHLPEDRPTFGNLRDLLWKLKNNENPYVNIDPLENFSLPPIDTEGIEDDSYENIPLNIPSPARVTKTESPRKVVSREKNVQQGMSNPAFRPLNHQDSDDSEPKEEKDETLKELEDNLANSSC